MNEMVEVDVWMGLDSRLIRQKTSGSYSCTQVIEIRIKNDESAKVLLVGLKGEKPAQIVNIGGNYHFFLL